MADLIDRSALLKEIWSIGNQPWSEWETVGVVNLVNRQTAVDAMEVVRCIDCKYACLVTDHDLQCLYDEDSLVHPHSHYCSYGEKREGTL